MASHVPSDSLDLCVNIDQPGQGLVVVHNTMDDEGGFDGSAIEGGRYLMPGIRSVLADTRMKITELDPILMDLSQEEKPKAGDKTHHIHPIRTHAKIGIDQVYRAFMEGKKVLSLGGNHVRALDVLGALRACHEQGIKMGMIWVDAHPDLNTPESTPSGHIHGMVSAHLHGRGAKELLDLLEEAPFIDPHDFIYIGIKNVDDNKNDDGSKKEDTELTYLRALIEKGVRCYPMEDMKDARKIDRVPDKVKAAVLELSNRLKENGGKLWLEWDVDSVDVTDMPAAVMENKDGMSGAQINDLFNHIGSYCSVDGVGVSELNPEKDVEGKSLKLTVDAIGNLFGVSDANYSVHNDRSRKEMRGEQVQSEEENSTPVIPVIADKTNNVSSISTLIESAPVTSTVTTKKNRNAGRHVLGGLAAGFAAGVLAMLGGDRPIKTEQQKINVAAAQESAFLKDFSHSDFTKTLAHLRIAAKKGDEKEIDQTLNELAQIYLLAKNDAPRSRNIADLGQVALSEFRRVFDLTDNTNEYEKYYRLFRQKII